MFHNVPGKNISNIHTENIFDDNYGNWIWFVEQITIDNQSL